MEHLGAANRRAAPESEERELEAADIEAVELEAEACRSGRRN
jgi:hypothetical protein